MSKPISDIRLFASRVPNEDGYPLPADFGSQALTLRLRRIAMKLRELSFSLGDFDHLYVNLTPCLPMGMIQPAQRSVPRETAWLRYVDVGSSEDFLNRGDEAALLQLIERCLQIYAQDDNAQQNISAAIAASATGEHMPMLFKEQTAGGIRAVIFLRLLDNGMYHPLLCAYDSDSQELLHADLAPDFELHALGSLRVTRQAVTLMPRKNTFAASLKPLRFPIPPAEPRQTP